MTSPTEKPLAFTEPSVVRVSKLALDSVYTPTTSFASDISFTLTSARNTLCDTESDDTICGSAVIASADEVADCTISPLDELASTEITSYNKAGATIIPSNTQMSATGATLCTTATGITLCEELVTTEIISCAVSADNDISVYDESVTTAMTSCDVQFAIEISSLHE